MKQVADAKRRDIKIQEGDLVFLKLHLYRQQIVFKCAYQKLANKFYRPYSIEKRVGKMACELKLLKRSCILPIFHISLHKKKLGESCAANIDLPPITDKGIIVIKPEAILDMRWTKQGLKFIEQSLVKWQRLPTEDATSDNTIELRDKFCSMDLEDKYPVKEGGTDKRQRSQRVPMKNCKYLDNA